jgi:aspartate-semialdehyde dehydrogenase
MKDVAYIVGLVGGAELLGKEIVAVLEEGDFSCARVVALVESNEEIVDLSFHDESVPVEFVSEAAFRKVDLVFFAGQGKASSEWLPAAVKAGCLVVDCSAGDNAGSRIPLIAAAVNEERVAESSGVVACPRAASLQLATVIKPLHDAYTVKRVVVSTYHSVSVKGQPGIAELEAQLRHLLNYQEALSEVFPYQIAFNCLPQVGSMDEDEYTSEEKSIVQETRSMLGDQSLQITATSCTIPVLFGHCLSVNIETEAEVDPHTARAILSQSRSVTVFDNPGEHLYPMPLVVSGHDDVFVGRIRRDGSVEHGLNLWIAGDNIRNEACNAVRIGAALLKHQADGSN